LQSALEWVSLLEPEDVVIEILIARAPALLMLVVLVLLAWVALLQLGQPELLAAGVPATVVLALYLCAGRGGAAP
jgi:hypothetical protein